MEYELMRVTEFLSANWSLFEAFCAEHGDDAEEISKTLEDQL